MQKPRTKILWSRSYYRHVLAHTCGDQIRRRPIASRNRVAGDIQQDIVGFDFHAAKFLGLRIVQEHQAIGVEPIVVDVLATNEGRALISVNRCSASGRSAATDLFAKIAEPSRGPVSVTCQRVILQLNRAAIPEVRANAERATRRSNLLRQRPNRSGAILKGFVVQAYATLRTVPSTASRAWGTSPRTVRPRRQSLRSRRSGRG